MVAVQRSASKQWFMISIITFLTKLIEILMNRLRKF